jgi:hypothetical protein
LKSEKPSCCWLKALMHTIFSSGPDRLSVQPVTLECVDRYVACLQAGGQDVRHLHKTKVHTYLAGKKDFAGLKIGEAARVGAWNWKHSKLELFRGIVTGM